METRLKSVFRNPKLRLLNKALIFAALLWILRSGEFGFWPTLLFLGGVSFLYIVPMFRTLETAPVFLILLLNSLFVLRTFSSSWYFWMAAAYFTSLFYLLLGVKELAFVRRDSWRRLLVLGLAYPAFLIFFYYRDADIALKLILLFVEVAVLTKSVLPQRLQSWLVSLLSLEVAWSTLFLPVGFISQAGIATLFHFLLMDTIYHYAEKQIHKKMMLVHATLLIVLTLSVLALSRWGV